MVMYGRWECSCGKTGAIGLGHGQPSIDGSRVVVDIVVQCRDCSSNWFFKFALPGTPPHPPPDIMTVPGVTHTFLGFESRTRIPDDATIVHDWDSSYGLRTTVLRSETAGPSTCALPGGGSSDDRHPPDAIDQQAGASPSTTDTSATESSIFTRQQGSSSNPRHTPFSDFPSESDSFLAGQQTGAGIPTILQPSLAPADSSIASASILTSQQGSVSNPRYATFFGLASDTFLEQAGAGISTLVQTPTTLRGTPSTRPFTLDPNRVNPFDHKTLQPEIGARNPAASQLHTLHTAPSPGNPNYPILLGPQQINPSDQTRLREQARAGGKMIIFCSGSGSSRELENGKQKTRREAKN